VAAIGFPGMQIVMSVTGTAEQDGPSCEVPGGTSWVSVSPVAGSVAPGGSQSVQVTFDSTGLATGEVLEANLCLQSNDPARPLVVVPVSLVVDEVETPVIEVSPGALELEVVQGGTASGSLSIANVGEGVLEWVVSEADPQVGQVTGRGSPVRAAAPAAAVAGGSPQAVPAAEVILDGGFEAGTPNPFWAEGSSTFGTPLCTVAACGTGTGTGPHSGSWWTWFGGISALETGFVRQDVTLVPGTAELRFWLEIPVGSGTGQDFMAVSIDGVELFRVTDADAADWQPYREVVLDVSQFADGGTHTLSFDSTVFGGGTTNFFVDDVSLVNEEQQLPPGACDVGADVPWLSVSPVSGSTGAGGADTVSVLVDASGLDLGVHEALLCVDSNDPVTPRVEVPVTVTVVEDTGEPGPGPEPVVCDRVVLGVHPGALTVESGVTCLAAGAMVLGEVNVLGGAGLISTAAVVQGPVSAVGASVVDLAFTQVTGPVLVSGATGRVSLFASQVTGSVSLVGSDTSPTEIVVAGNTVIGSLSCFGNSPDPTHHGLTNIATAGKFGQCAEL
jgi:hypothetical protein